MFKRNKKQDDLSKNVIVREKPMSPISEQYRSLRSNIKFTMVDGNFKTLIVTSSSQTEGKSTTSANLAVAFAQQDKKVLLVDADLRKPTVHKRFRLRNNIGLTNVLVDKLDFNSVMLKSESENLWFLTSGATPPNPSELLDSNAMKTLVESLREKFDVIIFDAPPVLPVSDAKILGKLCDGALVVLKQSHTKKEHLTECKKELDIAGIKVLGTVLTNVKVDKDNKNYYYYGE